MSKEEKQVDSVTQATDRHVGLEDLTPPASDFNLYSARALAKSKSVLWNQTFPEQIRGGRPIQGT